MKKELKKVEFAIETNVSKVKLKIDNDKIIQIRLFTDIGEITNSPKQSNIKSGELADFETEEYSSKEFNLKDFLLENPMLIQLNKNCKNKPQKVVLTVRRFLNEKDEIKQFMYAGDWYSIHYETFHKEDKSNIKKQLDKMKKHQERLNKEDN